MFRLLTYGCVCQYPAAYRPKLADGWGVKVASPIGPLDMYRVVVARCRDEPILFRSFFAVLPLSVRLCPLSALRPNGTFWEAS